MARFNILIIEGLPRDDGPQPPPILPEEYSRAKIHSIPKIPLPNGRYVFYTHLDAESKDHMLNDTRIRKDIIGESWGELFWSNYKYWDWVFDAEISEVIDGQLCRIRRKLANVTDQEVHGFWIPGMFAGEKIEKEFPAPIFVVDRYRRLRADTQLVVPVLRYIDDHLFDVIKSDPNKLYEMTSRQFEELICDLLNAFGWRVELTKATRDGGYDIFGISGATGGIESSWLIECKKYGLGRKVGVDVVRSICGVKEQEKVANAMVVTTSSFTRDTVAWSRNRLDLVLKDRRAVMDWIDQANL